MLRLFFEAGDTFQFLGGNFLQASNKLDSHKYALERVVEPVDNYVRKEYFSERHEKMAIYYTSWIEKQAVLEAVSPKVYKKKGTSIASLLNRKVKGEISTIPILGKNGQSSGQQGALLLQRQSSKETEVLYIQLEPFSFTVPKMDFQESCTYMSIVYLLAKKVYKSLGEGQKQEAWPRMIPITTEDGVIKFLKKGRSLNQQLYGLFKNTFGNEQSFDRFPEGFKSIVMNAEINGDRNLIAETVKELIKPIINGLYPLKIVRGTESNVEKCQLTELGDLLLTESGICIPLEEFTVQYSYSYEENRQITLLHSFLKPIVLIGNRTVFLIKYLKQFKQV